MKRKKKGKRALREARLRWVRGAGRYAESPPPKTRVFACDDPDTVFAGMAPRVPRSCDVEGHEERIRAHAERMAAELAREAERDRTHVTCDACGVVASRAGNVSVREVAFNRREDWEAAQAQRWVCRRVGSSFNESYCRACFDVWGWPEEYARRVDLFARGLIRPDPEPEVA